MPALTRHHPVPAPRQARSARNSTDSNEGAGEHLWVVDEDYEKSQKEIDFPSVKAVKMPSSETVRKPHGLRIDTYTKTDLQDRYLSSEEEPSPSPLEDGHDQLDNEPKLTTEILVDDDALDGSITEYKAEIAIAVPIVAYGRPKLIDITNLAPMHKRKRSSDSKLSVPHPSIRATASRASSSITDENNAVPVKDNIEVAVIPEKQPAQPATLKHRKSHQLKPKESFPVPPPDSWFPEEDSTDTADDASSKSDSHSSSERPDDDHVSLKSARLPRPQNLCRKHRTESVRRSSPVSHTAGLKSFTRTMSLIKRQSTQFQVNKQLVKKPKMIPRGASERQEMPVIPPFPFEGEVTVA